MNLPAFTYKGNRPFLTRHSPSTYVVLRFLGMRKMGNVVRLLFETGPRKWRPVVEPTTGRRTYDRSPQKTILGSGVDVMITIFGDFGQFSSKKLRFSQKPML
jgi:hypothetical protein